MAISKFSIKSAQKSRSAKRVTLADLEKKGGWEVNAVSLVDEPAVPKAKWIAIKSKNKDNVAEKAVQGSFEHRIDQIQAHLNAVFSDTEYYPHIHSTLDDSFVFYFYDEDGSKRHYLVKYQVDENGTIEVTSDPIEVKIEETIVTLDGEINEETEENEDETVEEAEKAEKQNKLLSKFMKAVGLVSKSGKVERPMQNNLKQAQKSIDEFLELFEKERQGSKKGVEKMNKEDIVTLIDERLEPLNSKLDDVLKAMKAQAKDEENNDLDDTAVSKGKNDDEAGEAATKSKDDEEDYKAKYEEVLKQLEKRPFSHRLVGQDNDNATKSSEIKPDRNPFGYKIKG